MSDRKVHFKVPIHHIEYLDKQWETASRLARDGSDWLRMGLDRQRFRDRIERTAELLDKILEFEFRQQIYQERFENFVISEQQTTKAKQISESTDAPPHQSQLPPSKRQHNKRNKRRRHRRGNNSHHRRYRGGHRKNK